MNQALENLVKMADQATSRKLVADVVRTAYALGKFDAVVDMTVAEVDVISLERDRRLEDLL